VWNAAVWSNYLEFQRVMKPRKMRRSGRYVPFLMDLVKSGMMKKEAARVARLFDGRLKYVDPDFDRMIRDVTPYFDERAESIVLVGLAQVLNLIRGGVDGIASLGAFHCMVDNVISARMLSICREHDHLPLLRLAFDFQQATHQQNRIEAFAQQVKQRHAARRKG
jgi:predicted nucleotide-binding protein (sugar kinase/HSP70/actin superfamily)